MALTIPAFDAYHKFAIEMMEGKFGASSGMPSRDGQVQDVTDALNATFLRMKEQSGDPNATFELGQVLGRINDAPNS